MVRYEKLIFVCTGNTCRGPMAEAIYHKLDLVKNVTVISRGLVVLFSEPANPKAELVLKKHNLSIEKHRSIGLTQSDIDEDTLILTMTREQKEKVCSDYQNVDNVYTLKEFNEEEGDVTDPYGKDLEDYEECYKELLRLVDKTIKKFYKED